MYLSYCAGAPGIPTYDRYVSLVFDVAIPNLLLLPNYMS